MRSFKCVWTFSMSVAKRNTGINKIMLHEAPVHIQTFTCKHHSWTGPSIDDSEHQHSTNRLEIYTLNECVRRISEYVTSSIVINNWVIFKFVHFFRTFRKELTIYVLNIQYHVHNSCDLHLKTWIKRPAYSTLIEFLKKKNK